MPFSYLLSTKSIKGPRSSASPQLEKQLNIYPGNYKKEIVLVTSSLRFRENSNIEIFTQTVKN